MGRKPKLLTGTEKFIISLAATQEPAVLVVPYMIARVFHSNFTYSLPIVSDQEFVRLYFYTNSYKCQNAIVHPYDEMWFL
ncbi:hypothetical protein GOBAR_AA06027 [Gossypium barbadense]|uniref:Uncharacterized protein n=1 Tax=Gossypium barbadense TaxID=3634 RepID=A0A2P5YG51_GOSBA|nr:hypothetical protein GOBAR_AA06027 [Gossypium barbadense]